MQPILRTAQEMYGFTCEHGLGRAMSQSWGLNSFALIERALEPDEQAFITFIGLHRFRSMSAHERNFAYAFTNKRLIMAQMRAFWRTRLDSQPISSLRNLQFDTDSSVGVMQIVLENDVIRVGMAQETAQKLGALLSEQLPLLQELARQNTPEA